MLGSLSGGAVLLMLLAFLLFCFSSVMFGQRCDRQLTTQKEVSMDQISTTKAIWRTSESVSANCAAAALLA